MEHILKASQEYAKVNKRLDWLRKHRKNAITMRCCPRGAPYASWLEWKVLHDERKELVAVIGSAN